MNGLKQLRIPLLAAAAAASLVIASCGGNGGSSFSGGSTGGPPPPGPFKLTKTSVAGKITLPAAKGRAPQDYRIVTSAGSVVPASDGRFSVSVFNDGPQLAIVVDGAGSPVLLGMVGRDQPDISARSTAEAYAFYGMGGWFHEGEVADNFAQELHAESTDLAGLTAAIEDGFIAGETLEQMQPDLVEPLGEFKMRYGSRGTTVNPADGRSGITIDISGDNEIKIVNNYRRNAVGWIDRVSATFEDGTEEPRTAELHKFDVKSTTGYRAVAGTIIDAIHGNYAFAPRVTGPFAAEVVPEEAVSTKYRVTIMGLGGSEGDYSSLPAARQDLWTQVALKSLVLDLCVPIVTNIAMPLQSNSPDELMEYLRTSDALTSVIGGITTGAPGVVTKLQEGDVKGAMLEALSGFADQEVLRAALFAAVYQGLLHVSGHEIADDFRNAASSFMRALKVVDALGTGFDSAVQIENIVSSNWADIYEVDVTTGKVSLDPKESTIKADEYQLLTATVQNAGDTGAAYEFRWSASKGRVSDGERTGTEITTTSKSVYFYPDNVGASETATGSVQVQAFRIQGTDRLPQGKAQARIQVFGRTYARLAPNIDSFHKNEEGAFEVYFEPAISDLDGLIYRFTLQNGLGALTNYGEYVTSPVVEFQAGSELGTDFVIAEVFRKKNGQLEKMGEAKSEVRIEERKSVIDARFVVHILHGGAYADVVWDAPEGAKHYVMHGTGGREGHLTASMGASTWTHDHKGEAPAGEVWHSLSAVWSSDLDEAAVTSYFNERFAGYKFRVIVTY